MKKILIATVALLSLAGVAQADGFDLNSMPLSGFTPKLDAASTGSIAPGKVFVRKVKHDGVSVTQYYTIAKDGAVEVLSEK